MENHFTPVIPTREEIAKELTDGKFIEVEPNLFRRDDETAAGYLLIKIEQNGPSYFAYMEPDEPVSNFYHRKFTFLPRIRAYVALKEQ